jgi:RNA polymerase sigma factor (sigma-70 family)
MHSTTNGFTPEIIKGYEKVLNRFSGEHKRKSKTDADVLCPVHDDHNPSLGVDLRHNGAAPKVILNCRSQGCRIRWSILDELRKVDPLSRRTRMGAHQIERTRDELVQKLGRAPTDSELVGQLGISVSEHWAFLDQYARAQVRSLEARYRESPGAGPHDLICDHSAIDPASAAEAVEVPARLVRAMECRGEQERVVTTFCYYEGLTPREIGRVLNLTEGRISQILHGALVRLGQSLAEESRLSERMQGR